MEAFELKRLRNDKQELGFIIKNVGESADYEEYLLDQLMPNQLKSQTGERIERNIDTMHEIKRKLQEVYKMMFDLHKDNICANAFKERNN